MKHCLSYLVLILCHFQNTMASFVDQVEHVSLVHGHYSEVVVDLTVVAPDPLVLARYYSSRDSDLITTIGGWCFNPYTILSAHKGLKEGDVYVQAIDPDGTILMYAGSQNRVNPSKLIAFKMDPVLERVCGEGIDRLMITKGHDLYFNPRTDSFELTLSSGGKRLYVKHPIVSDVYVMKYEILPSGNKVLYEWDEEGRIAFIKETNNSESKVLAWIRLCYENGIRAEASDGRIVEYRFQQEGEGFQLLTEVYPEDRPSIHYQYQIVDGHILLCRKSRTDGKSERIDYYEEFPYKVRSVVNGKLSIQFSYKDDSTTEINSIYEGKVVYQYNEKGQQVMVECYLEGGSLYQVHKRSWDTNALTETIEDAMGNVLCCKQFFYDKKGVLVEEREQGKTIKKYSCFYERNTYGFTQTDDQGTEIKYWYKKGTRLLLKKCIIAKSNDGEELKERHFYTYNEDGVLTRIAVDNGEEVNKSVKECQGVTERTLTVIFPKQDIPNVGAIEVIEQKYETVDGASEFLLKRTVNQLDDVGNIVSQTIYDENEVLCYTITKEYDQGLLAFETDPLGNSTYYFYDENRNLVLEAYPDRELFIEHEYDAKNLLISTVLQDREGNRLEMNTAPKEDTQLEGRSYDHKGRLTKEDGKTYRYNAFHKVSEEDERGELITYSYASSGRLTAVNKGDQKVEFLYDGLGRVLGLKKWKSQSSFTLEAQEYDLLDRITQQRIEDQNGKVLLKVKFVYDDSGRLVQVIGYPNNKESIIFKYEYDEFGRMQGDSKEPQVCRYDEKPFFKKLEDDLRHYQVERTYDGEGKIQTLQLLDGSCIEYGYEGPFVKEMKRINKEGLEIYQYSVASRDLMGHVIEEILPGELGSRKFFWDEIGRRIIEISTDFFQDKAELLKEEPDIKENRLCKRREPKSKKTAKEFLYLGKMEIGSIDENGVLIDLKIPSDPNDPEALSIAIELKKGIYVPLYDLQGNIVHLLDPEKRKIVETYHYFGSGEEEIINQRGKVISDSLVGNPWRYGGKRDD